MHVTKTYIFAILQQSGDITTEVYIVSFIHNSRRTGEYCSYCFPTGVVVTLFIDYEIYTCINETLVAKLKNNMIGIIVIITIIKIAWHTELGKGTLPINQNDPRTMIPGKLQNSKKGLNKN